MKNYFKLQGNDLASYHDDLTSICSEFTYCGYRFFWELPSKEEITADDVVDVLTLTQPWFVDDSIYEEYCNFYNFYEDAIYDIIEDHLVDEGINEEDKMFEYNPFHTYKTIDIDGQYVEFIDSYSGVAGRYWEEMVKDISIVPKENLHIRQYVENIVSSARRCPNEIRYWLEKLPHSSEYDGVVDDHIDALCYAIRHNIDSDINYNMIDLCDYYIANKELYKFD